MRIQYSQYRQMSRKEQDTTFNSDDVTATALISKQHYRAHPFLKIAVYLSVYFNYGSINFKPVWRGRCHANPRDTTRPVGESSTMEHSETQPLLEPDSYQTQQQNYPRADIPAGYPDGLPGANHGKALSWTSAYILVVSRVIGSGIFATPGSIVKSAGSIGLSLLIWLVGTILAACGMAVSMEYGCMLPRSGGDKVNIHPVGLKRAAAKRVPGLLGVYLSTTAISSINSGRCTSGGAGVHGEQLHYFRQVYAFCIQC